jgi:hypothetical protein
MLGPLGIGSVRMVATPGATDRSAGGQRLGPTVDRHGPLLPATMACALEQGRLGHRMVIVVVAWIIVLLLGLTAVSSILASIFGVHMILLAIGSTLFTIAAGRGAFALTEWEDGRRHAKLKAQEQLKRQQEAKRAQDIRKLDRDCADIFRRAETAVGAILAFNARVEERFRVPVDKNELTQDVNSILEGAKDITKRRAQVRSIIAISSSEPQRPSQRNFSLGDLLGYPVDQSADMRPGPMTAKAIEPLQRVIDIKFKSMESSVKNLEAISSSIKEMDALYRDWAGARQAELLADQFRDTYVSAERDKLAAREFNRLAKEVANIVQAFRQSIEQINLEVETLSLPDDEDP